MLFSINLLSQFQCCRKTKHYRSRCMLILWKIRIKVTTKVFPIHTKKKIRLTVNFTLISEYTPKPSSKQSNVLPLWGNERTMNLNPLILTNIQSSHYFKGMYRFHKSVLCNTSLYKVGYFWYGGPLWNQT